MSERKVLNKYYPPDYDPAKIPKLGLPRNRQFSIRIMAPFNMRCLTCGEYIYKGKKFNSRSEMVENETYLGIKIMRFYIRCPRCVAEISFKTDPVNTDYELEGGATRNFEAAKTAEKMAQKEIQEKEDEEKNNPMKVLENRTKSSRQEMEMLETLEELRELNSRHAKVDHDQVIQLNAAVEVKAREKLIQLQEEEDEKFINSLFGKDGDGIVIKRLKEEEEEEEEPRPRKMAKPSKPTDILTQGNPDSAKATTSSLKPLGFPKKTGGFTKKSLGMLVKRKQPAKTTTPETKDDKGTASVKPESMKPPVSNDNLMRPPVASSNHMKPSVDSDNMKPVTEANTAEPSVGSGKNTEAALDRGIKTSTDTASDKGTDKGVATGKTESDSGDKKTDKVVPVTKPVASGLGLLGSYSGSDSDSSN